MSLGNPLLPGDGVPDGFHGPRRSATLEIRVWQGELYYLAVWTVAADGTNELVVSYLRPTG